MMNNKFPYTILILLLTAPLAHAQVFKCDGKWVNKPCADSEQTIVAPKESPSCMNRSVYAAATQYSPSLTSATTFKVESGTTYRITASGTYFAGDGVEADAKYNSRFNGAWQDVVHTYEGQGPQLLDLQIYDPQTRGFVSPDWGAFNDVHRYTIEWVASSPVLQMRIFDFKADNNRGELRVEVCKLSESQTTAAATPVVATSQETKKPSPALVTIQRAYWPNGKLKSDYSKKSYFDIGPFWLYYENGNLRATGQFAQSSNRDGVWRTFYDNGKIESEMLYKDSNSPECTRAYEKDGSPKNGIVKEYSLNSYSMVSENQVLAEMSYRNGVRDGTSTTCHVTPPSKDVRCDGTLVYEKDAFKSYRSVNAEGKVTYESTSVDAKPPGEDCYKKLSEHQSPASREAL